MNQSFLYIADGKLYMADDTGEREIRSGVLDSYVRKVRESAERSAWKRSGEGAMFTGTYEPGATPADRVASVRAQITAAVKQSSRILYAIDIDGACGIYAHPLSGEGAEGIVISHAENAYRHFHINGKRMAVAVGFAGESHIGVLEDGRADCRLYTEGRSWDSEPVWSKTDPDCLYFCSAGLAVGDGQPTPDHPPLSYAEVMERLYDAAASEMRGPAALCLLDIKQGSITELLCDPAFDFVHPQSMANGALYYVKKPYREQKSGTSAAGCLIDLLLLPVRLLRAVFGFFNIFSMKYSGKTLSRTGQVKRRDPGEMLIDGNLINAEKELRANRDRGDKNPGIIPRSWELRRRDPDGTDTLVRRGVVAFLANEDGSLLFSNGNGIFSLSPDGREELVSNAPRVTFLS